VAHDVDIVDVTQTKLDSWYSKNIASKLPISDPFQLKIDTCIARAIAIDGLPLDFTSGDGFCELLQTLNPKITIKSRRTMTKKFWTLQLR
ncbi:unnamed protein product, partial [Allacma fusca]